MTSMKERLGEVRQLTRRLQREFPQETTEFVDFAKHAEGGIALTLKEEELINTALAVAAQCEWCIAFHVRNVARGRDNGRNGGG
jgi:AhpD family alkylhydroperoxidase